MLHPVYPYARVRPTDRSEIDSPSPTIQHQAARHELALVRQREIQAYCAGIATSRQVCRDARDQMATATERIICSRHALATSREILGRGS